MRPVAMGVLAAAGALAVSWAVMSPVPDLPTPVLTQSLYTVPDRGFEAQPEQYWIRANFHSHAKRGTFGVGDDGRSEPRVMHEVYGRLGYDFSLHTPHSNRNTTKRSLENWMKLKELTEVELDRALPGAQSLGIELSVAHGPNLAWFSHRRYGQGVKRTLNHALLLGVDEYCPTLTPLKGAAEHAHAYGGLLFVAHPVIWEKDYFTRAGVIDKVDGLEVYNGIVLVKTQETEEAPFRWATAYGGAGVRMAAIAGTDSHGLAWVKDVITWVLTTHNDTEAIVDAIQRRRTFVTRGLFGIDLSFPQLGHVLHTGDVVLDFALNRSVERIELWKEMELAKAWDNASEVHWRERIDENAAYTFRITDGEDRGFTSPVWFEPNPLRKPDLTIPADGIELRGTTVRALVRNIGDAAAHQVPVAVYPGVPFYRGASANAKKARRRIIARLGPGEEVRIEVGFEDLPELVWVKVDPESYWRDDDDQIEELDERNNAAVWLISGAIADRARRARHIRSLRSDRRVTQGFARRSVRPPLSEVAALVGEYTDEGIPELDTHD